MKHPQNRPSQLSMSEIVERIALLDDDPTNCTDDYVEQCRQVLAIAERSGTREQQLNIYCILARTMARRGDFEESIQICQTILPELRQKEDKRRLMVILNTLSITYCNEARYDESIGIAQEALGLAKELGRKDAEGHISGNIGLSFSYLGDMDQAIRFYHQCLSVWKDLEDPIGMGNALINIGIAYMAFEDWGAAENSFNKAEVNFKKINYLDGLSSVEMNRALIATKKGEFEKALELIESSFSKDTGNRFKQLQYLETKAKILAKMGRSQETLELGKKSSKTTQKCVWIGGGWVS